MTQEARHHKGHHNGKFDGYYVTGFEYEVDGVTGWHIAAWHENQSPIHDYWVTGPNFHSALFHYFYKGTPINLVEIFHPPITEQINQDELVTDEERSELRSFEDCMGLIDQFAFGYEWVFVTQSEMRQATWLSV
jgi:hypothetical protein